MILFKRLSIVFVLLLGTFCPSFLCAQSDYTLFDDKALLDGYAQKYAEETKEILLEIIKDDTLTPYMTAAAVRVFKDKYAKDVFPKEKSGTERILLLCLQRSDSSFVKAEIMHTLCILDRFKYFNSLVPDLIQLLNHYNTTVNEMAFQSLQDLFASKHNRPREARIVFNTLRKMFFLSRKRLQNVKTPSPRLKQKLEILRWSIKILGTQELKKLPPEVINLL